jgi:anthranilate phosphoribosyltransferase
MTVDPVALGIHGNLAGLAGGDAAVNLDILTRVLGGEAHGATDAVALNAGALLWLAGAASSVADGLALARQLLQDGSAREHFAAWLQVARSLHGSGGGVSSGGDAGSGFAGGGAAGGSAADVSAASLPRASGAPPHRPLSKQ